MIAKGISIFSRGERRGRWLVALVVVLMSGVACTDMELERGAIGAIGGAAVGGILGGGRGAATGAVAGGLLGAATAPEPQYYSYGYYPHPVPPPYYDYYPY